MIVTPKWSQLELSTLIRAGSAACFAKQEFDERLAHELEQCRVSMVCY